MPCSFQGGLAVSATPVVWFGKNEDRGWGIFERTATEAAADTNCRRVTLADMAMHSFDLELGSILT
jgi:hypothetical protein